MAFLKSFMRDFLFVAIYCTSVCEFHVDSLPDRIQVK